MAVLRHVKLERAFSSVWTYFCGPDGFEAGQVLSALEGIEKDGVVKHAGGQRLLEVSD